MLCDKCKKRPATVHYQQVINGQAREQHLCGQCAAGFGAFGTLDLNKLFAAPAPQEQISCPVCGMSLGEFQAVGRFGCSYCYQAFAEAIKPLIRRYHGDRRHKGKIKHPLKYQTGSSELLSPPEGKLADKTYEKLALQKQLAELVELERFEDAAKIRDKIKAVEGEIAAMAKDNYTGSVSGKAGEEK